MRPRLVADDLPKDRSLDSHHLIIKQPVLVVNTYILFLLPLSPRVEYQRLRIVINGAKNAYEGSYNESPNAVGE